MRLILLLWVPVVYSHVSLHDLINTTQQEELLQSLSESVAKQYEDTEPHYDDSQLINFEEAPISVNALNAKYRHALYEGDMVLHPKTIRALARNQLSFAARIKRKAFFSAEVPDAIWNTGVPYKFHSSLSPKAIAKIEEAIEFWRAETCVEFRVRTNERQYLEFTGDDGCWSTVGKDSTLGRQVLSIGQGCEHFGITSHELAHALGVFHEQSRYDRDAFVTINKRAIPPSLIYNFAKVSPSDMKTYGLGYDIGSVMHYTPTDLLVPLHRFSTSKRVPVLTAVDPNLQQTMGQLEGPSFLDVMVINRHYSCQASCSYELPCENGGYTNPRNCSRCKCPTGFGGRLCETVAPSFSPRCGGVLDAIETVKRFEISISQSAKIREKRCIYHIKAPPSKRVLVNIISVNARCVEGCYIDGVEFKMTNDFKPVGYRYCCKESSSRSLISQRDIAPVIITSTRQNMSLIFEYTYVDATVRRDQNNMLWQNDYSAEEPKYVSTSEEDGVSVHFS